MDNKSSNNWLPIATIAGLFFMFGFVTWLNGALIPFLQIACELDHSQAYLVTMFFYIAYTLLALPSAKVLQRTGFKVGMALGLLVMSVGALLFIPAAYYREFSLFLLALFALGGGLTLLQTASNPYIVMLGPVETAAVRISLMGILNKLAGVFAPIVFTTWVLADMHQFTDVALASLSPELRESRLDELSARLIEPYILMALVLASLAIALFKFHLPEPGVEEEQNDKPLAVSGLLQFPHLIWGAITLFFYVGVEVIAGDSIGLFGKSLGVDNFTQLTSYTMGFMVLGYILGMLFIPRLISQRQALQFSALLGIALSILILILPAGQSLIWPVLGFWSPQVQIPDVVLIVALLGLANALVWPAVWPLALKELGAYTSMGAALLIMGIAGGAILPMLYGGLADWLANPKQAYMLLLPCYLFILFYAVWGHKVRRNS